MCINKSEVKVKLLSHVQLFATPWTAAHHAPPSVHGIFQARILGVGCHFLLQGIFVTQRLNLHLLGLLHCRYNHWLYLRADQVLE